MLSVDLASFDISARSVSLSSFSQPTTSLSWLNVNREGVPAPLLLDISGFQVVGAICQADSYGGRARGQGFQEQEIKEFPRHHVPQSRAVPSP